MLGLKAYILGHIEWGKFPSLKKILSPHPIIKDKHLTKQ